MKIESERRKTALEEEEKMRRKLLEENKLAQEKKLREIQAKKDLQIRKRMLEERWEMAKWISSYISENEEKWRVEKREREENSRKWLEDWSRLERFEKIRKIRERKG